MYNDGCTGEKGVYALIINVQSSTLINFKGMPARLDPGTYVYIGSAHGPGGVKARVRRHLKPEKKTKWHIDKVTTLPYAQIICVVCAETQSPECILTPHLEKHGFIHPLPGFGSSDCRRGCTSHFFKCNKNPAECIRAVQLAFQESRLENVQTLYL
ncbi:MAG: GIY-YIG nuclease family protein [Infirmifilum sp.]